MKLKSFILLILITIATTVKISYLNARLPERRYQNFATYLIDGFSVTDSWIVKFSRFRVHNWDTNSRNFMESQAFVRWKKVERNKARFILPPYPKEQKRMMINRYGENALYSIVGIRAKFVANGYNWIVFEPRKKIFLKGIARRVNIWIWGGNYRYNLYIHVKDFKGGIHEIYGGKIDFVGWKHVSIRIPHTIRQRDVHMPANKYLQFLRIKLISEFDEDPEKFYIWFGSIWAEVDLYKDRFWGDGLLNEPNW